MTGPHRIPKSLVVLFVLVSISCGPQLRLYPNGKTIQEQCGVRYGTAVTREQAICIATLGGLDGSLRPWRIEENRHGSPDEQNWEVCNTTEPAHGGSGPAGDCWQIRIRDGKVIFIGTWERITVY